MFSYLLSPELSDKIPAFGFNYAVYGKVFLVHFAVIGQLLDTVG